MRYELMFAIVPAVLWIVLRILLPNKPFEFDWDTAHATFTLLLDKFLKSAGCVGIIGLLLALYDGSREQSLFVVGSCLAAALYAFLFSVWLLVQYEAYLHQRYPRSGAIGISPYTTARHATTHALGWSAVIFFIVGVVGSIQR